MEKNVQAQFQMLDSYVDEVSINILEKMDSAKDMNINGRVGFGILNIQKNNNEMIGQIKLINDMKVLYKGEEKGKIHISMIGLFKIEGEFTEEQFLQMLQFNGAPTLAHLIRAYVYSITGLGGIPSITTPMINFVKFFENAESTEEKL